MNKYLPYEYSPSDNELCFRSTRALHSILRSAFIP